MPCRTHLEQKCGEALVRTLLAQQDERLKKLEAEYDAGEIGYRTLLYRLRWARADYNRLESLAKRYHFVI